VPAPANVAYASEAQASYGVGPAPTNWDIQAAGASGSYGTLKQVLAQVWPSAFYATTTGGFVQNTALVKSVSQPDLKTVVYQLNPKAVWSDGQPITYKDFRYNWQAQSGRAQYLDIGGQQFAARSHAGYHMITSVTGSAVDPYRVTVTFSAPYPGWRALFSYLVPAHVALAVGFDHGFTDPVTDLVSGGPYMVSRYQDGYSLTLVRNSLFWGAPANLATITYYFSSSAAQEAGALSQGELDIATLPASQAAFSELSAALGSMVHPVEGSTYEDLVLRLASPVLRRAVEAVLDRSAMASAVLSPYGLPATPVQNRYLLPGAPGYQANGSSFGTGDITGAQSLLTAAGYRLTGGTLVSASGKAVSLSLVVDATDPEAAQLADMVKSACSSLGIGVTVSALPGPPSDRTGWQMAVEQVALGTTLSPQVPAIASRLAELPQLAPGAVPALYNSIDALAWAGAFDIPVVGVPELVVTNPKLLNVVVGPYVGNLSFDEQDWGFAAS
jgi:peptide/nickel transport system substrate-binding protein